MIELLWVAGSDVIEAQPKTRSDQSRRLAADPLHEGVGDTLGG
jgi:hypothetical protein